MRHWRVRIADPMLMRRRTAGSGPRNGETMMEYDIGLQGLGILAGMSLVFGVLAQLIAARISTRWIGAIGAIGFLVGGLVASEWIFAWATVDDLQPLIDGLLLDEAMLGGIVVGLVAVAVTWLVTRQTRIHGPMGT